MAHDAEHHDHPDHLAHHFDTPKQQFEAGKLGMWLFIATEILLFGGLFVGYSVWRGNHPELFEYSSHFLDTTMGGINTAVLIASSLTMAAAVTVAQRNDPVKQDKRPILILLLVLTLCGAAGFMVIKYFEWTHKFAEGWYPGVKYYEKPSDKSHTWDSHAGVIGVEMTTIDTVDGAPTRGDLGLPDTVTVELPAAAPVAVAPDHFLADKLAAVYGNDDAAHAGDPHGADVTTHDAKHDEHEQTHPLQDPHRPRDAHIFFNIYYMMTGLHGIHVIIGGIVITWLLIKSFRGQFHRDYFTPVDLGGLYWHVVDLIWIFLFPLFYLIH